tara:strand:- start:1116 stop:1274 length:159 start_codon:yes stop_codon:yes gene_type:complete
MWPGEGIIKDIDGSIGQVFRLNNLHIQRPGRIVTSLDGVEEIFNVIVWFLTC